MATYEVACAACGKSMLFEHGKPLPDPGVLPAFCSDDCSITYAMRMFEPMEKIGILIDLSCGCLVMVYNTSGSGSTHPWPICEKAKGTENYRNHMIEIHREAVEAARQRS